MTTDQLLTLRDIAEVAGVQRAVVSMWRKRPTVRGQVVPFPEPARRVGRTDFFHRGDIDAYLAATGRGNNAEAELDAAAYAVPDVPFEVLLALLALRVELAEDLARADVVGRAGQLDPVDDYFRTEASRAEPRALEYVDELMSASFGPRDALARLDASRLGRTRRRQTLTSPAVTLLSAVVQELLVGDRVEGRHLVDLSPQGASSVQQVASAVDATVTLDADEVDRQQRLRARLLGLLADEDVVRPLRVTSLFGLDTDTVIRELDELQLALGPGELGLAIGPAAGLCDPVGDKDFELARDHVLRSGTLRAAVRLPRGMWSEARRQAGAIWLCQGGATAGRIAVADLSDQECARVDGKALGLDLIAALDSDARHAYRYVVRRDAAVILASDHVVTRGIAARHERSTTDDPALEIERLRGVIDAPLRPTGLATAPRRARARPAVVTLGELLDAGEVRLLRGTRLDPAWSAPEGTVAVADPRGEWSGGRFDPIDLEFHAPRAMRTEPGDVVFTSRPPHAEVEPGGGRVVASPGRVLRLAEDARLGPHVLAAQINRQPASATDVRSWRVTLTHDEALEGQLAHLASVRRDLTARAHALDDLTARLLDAVTTDQLSINHTAPAENTEND